jgi:CRP/FNR family transcriptional regulator, nitrogen oxide reductase regulator
MKTRRKSPVNLIITEEQHCSIDLRLKILDRLPFFADLPHHVMETINQRFVEVGYQPGDMVYMAGDPADRLFVVAEGKIKLLQHGLNGRNVLLDILTSGEFFGNLAALGVAAYPDTAQAQAPACILSIRSDSFRQVLDEHPELALRTLQVMGERLNAANHRVLRLSSMPVEKRIAFTLLELSKKLGRPKEKMLLIDVPLSRDDLAEMTGTTPETVSRVMSQFQSSGIIESGRQWVGINDLKPLEEMAGEE